MGFEATVRRAFARLTREDLPRAAAARGWPVRTPEEFERLLLDHLGNSSPKQARPCVVDLVLAVELGEQLLAGNLCCATMNRRAALRNRQGRPAPRGRAQGAPRHPGRKAAKPGLIAGKKPFTNDAISFGQSTQHIYHACIGARHRREPADRASLRSPRRAAPSRRQRPAPAARPSRGRSAPSRRPAPAAPPRARPRHAPSRPTSGLPMAITPSSGKPDIRRPVDRGGAVVLLRHRQPVRRPHRRRHAPRRTGSPAPAPSPPPAPASSRAGSRCRWAPAAPPPPPRSWRGRAWETRQS